MTTSANTSDGTQGFRRRQQRTAAPHVRTSAFLERVIREGADHRLRPDLVAAVRACGTPAMVGWATRPVRRSGALAASSVHSAMRSLAEVSRNAAALSRDAVPGRLASLIRRNRAHHVERRRMDVRAGESLSDHQRSLTLLAATNRSLSHRAASVASSARMAIDALTEDVAVLDAVRAGCSHQTVDALARDAIVAAATDRLAELARLSTALLAVERDATALSTAAAQAAAGSSYAATAISSSWNRLLRRVVETPYGGERPEAADLASALAGGSVPAPTGRAPVTTVDRLCERLGVVGPDLI